MDEYVSKVVKVNRMASDLYAIFSDLSMLSQLVPPNAEIENFQSSTDECTFKVKGVEVGLCIIDREPDKTVKYTGNGKLPFDFFFWVQLKEVAPYDTRVRLVLHTKMNMMMKLMLKGKLQKGIDTFAEQMAAAFNGQQPPQANFSS